MGSFGSRLTREQEVPDAVWIEVAFDEVDRDTGGRFDAATGGFVAGQRAKFYFALWRAVGGAGCAEGVTSISSCARKASPRGCSRERRPIYFVGLWHAKRLAHPLGKPLGKLSRNTAPQPATFSTARPPPWARARSRAMARPKPVPPPVSRRLRALSAR